MKLHIEAEMENKQRLGEIVQAFFQEFDARSSIEVTDLNVKMDLAFDKKKSPINLIIALSKGESNYRICYEGTDEEEFTGEIKEKKERKEPVVHFTIPEIDKIAEEADSFQSFLHEVTDWFEMKEESEVFEKMILLSLEMNETDWRTLQKELNSRETIQVKRNDACQISKMISNKMQKDEYLYDARYRHLNLRQLMVMIKKYKNKFDK